MKPQLNFINNEEPTVANVYIINTYSFIKKPHIYAMVKNEMPDVDLY